MKSKEFVKIAKDIATKYKTLYIMGCFGAPMTEYGKNRYTQNHSYNKKANRTKKIKNATSDTFGFDCVCLIKGILWGWNGNLNHIYGGAQYASKGVLDKDADQIMNYCTNVTTDFTKIIEGEIIWMSGHVGIYIGDGLVVECTPIWKDGVQITAVTNIGKKTGYNARKWTKHGKLKWVDYSDYTEPEIPQENPQEEPQKTTNSFSVGDKVIISGKLYVSSNAIKASGSIKNKITKITRIAKGAKHPYNTTGDLGWMDESSIKAYTEEVVTYTVQKGDYLIKIGKKFNVDWKDIAKLNNVKGPFYIIHTGQVLRIK